MERDHKLSFILPVFNPHEGWEKEFINSLDKLQDEFSDIEYCITVVDDGSTNDVGNIFKDKILPVNKNLKYFGYSENQGKGFAIRYGLERSFSDYYIYSDYDFPFGIHSLKQTFDSLVEGKTNLVIGARDIPSLRILPIGRRILSQSLMIVNLIVTRFRVSDTQAGLKGLDNKAKDIFLTTRTNSFVFELEFILKCLKANLNYGFVHIALNPDVKFTNFSAKIIKRELKNYFKVILGCI
jgi:glycosyltransferase involved in cell wall biosynthesis